MKPMNACGKLLCLLGALLMTLGSFAVTASAGSAYQTYVYDWLGKPLHSPDAYSAVKAVGAAEMGLEVPLENPGDMVTDSDLNVYIADTGNSRIVVLDRYYKLKFTISSFSNDQGVPDRLSAPQGVFVSDPNTKYAEKLIWVCDTGANRIVVFNQEGKFQRIIEEPESTLFDEESVYKPIAMAVDAHNRLYVVSSTTYQGIIVLTDDGEFTGFIGAQAVSMSPWEIIWRRFQTKAQREASEQKVSTEFNNITINRDLGLVYATTSTIDEGKVTGFIWGGDRSGTYSPVKLLNANGTEIMRRNGSSPPAGEINWAQNGTAEIKGPSTIIDAAVGPENTWSILDEKRNRIYTYDFDGKLLFAFGDNGTMLGNIGSVEALAYQDTDMLVLDKTNDNITVFRRTEYGNLLLEAIAAESTQDYDKAISLWTDILKRNSNFDTAYVGIGQAMYRDKDYENSLAFFKSAYDMQHWSQSYREIRSQWMSTYFLVLLLIVLLVILGVVFFFRWMHRINRRVGVSGERGHFGHEIAYAFHILFHPFDGFWDLKHEKRGSVRGAVFYVTLTILTFYYNAVGTGYLWSPFNQIPSLWKQITGVLVPLFLFVLANWCLTTLFDGEGSFRDVFIAASYSLLPIPLLFVPATILTNFSVREEANLISLLMSIAFAWMGLLLFFGVMVTHDYTLGRNALTILGTLVGMIFIMFIAVLFTTLIGKIVSLVTNLVTEIRFRM